MPEDRLRHFDWIFETFGLEPEEPPIEEFTCYICQWLDTTNMWACPFAYDLYNLNGDCLAEK